ncbi:hypothetical protein SEA_POKYPUPPY_64 [Gordonia phage PokyPuppy]|nr:hypothetical protein SEA_POKYPUPPY_64 [Gordonia phage PokyPuppy]
MTISRGTGYNSVPHRWYWRLADARGHGLATSPGSFSTAGEAIEAIAQVFPDGGPFQWLVKETPREKQVAFTATARDAKRMYDKYREVSKK